MRLFSASQLTLTQSNFFDYLLQNYLNKSLVCYGQGYDSNQNSIEYNRVTIKNIDGYVSFDLNDGSSTGKLSNVSGSFDVSEKQIF